MLSVRSIAWKQRHVLNRVIRCKTTVLSKEGEAVKSVKSVNSSSTQQQQSFPNRPSTQQPQSFPLAQCILAVGLGVSTVSAVAGLVESATASSIPTFDPKGQRYDPDNFVGRFSRMLLECDPRLLLYTEMQVLGSRDMVQNWQHYADGTREADRMLWEAKRVRDAAIHPDTGELIPRPFRMSGFVFYNGPVATAMVASQSTLPLLFWAWVNQSQNALVNYFNRNASSPMSNETLGKSYAGAVGSALAVAFGLATGIQKRFDAQKAKTLLRWVSFPSAVVAGILNCYIVRSPEIQTGIPLLDADGNNVLPGETSQVAATQGVYSTTISRAVLPAPAVLVPPILVSYGPLKTIITKHPHLALPITTYVLLICFGVGLPATVAIFPQIAEIDATQVEEKYQHLRHHKTQQPYNVFYYNKGL